jgi:membrane-bound lytic murein transglycosylase D
MRAARLTYTFLAFCLSTGLCQTYAFGKDSVITIKVDPSQIPKNANIIREPKFSPESMMSAEDSARFVKRKLRDHAEKPKTYGNFTVNKSIYGTYTDFIIDYVRNYHNNHGSRLQRIQSNNKGYFKLIENVMKRYNVPREMKSLAIIESAMNCNAVSPVGAVGPWQFMEGTAKMLGLRVDGQVDERRDFYKSTNAAARYLKQLHEMFQDWLLVIASYNCGPAPVLRAINSGAGRSFWDIKPRLPKETQNHVMAFIATSVFLDRACNPLGMGGIPKGAKAPKADFSSLSSFAGAENGEEIAADTKKPQFSQEELDQMAILKVKGVYRLQAISKVLDEDLVRLRRWNPDFDQTVSASETPVHLRIPMNKLEKFIVAKDQIIAESRKG